MIQSGFTRSHYNDKLWNIQRSSDVKGIDGSIDQLGSTKAAILTCQSLVWILRRRSEKKLQCFRSLLGKTITTLRIYKGSIRSTTPWNGHIVPRSEIVTFFLNKNIVCWRHTFKKHIGYVTLSTGIRSCCLSVRRVYTTYGQRPTVSQCFRSWCHTENSQSSCCDLFGRPSLHHRVAWQKRGKANAKQQIHQLKDRDIKNARRISLLITHHWKGQLPTMYN